MPTPLPTLNSPQLFEDVACTVCGCVCDDLKLTVENGRIVRAEGACDLAEPWLLAQNTRQPHVAEIQGRAVSIATAVAKAAEVLQAAKAPLIYGLSRSSTQGQRQAVRLADALGANIDTTASLCHAPSIMALQQVGESTCSLGEIRNRADLVIYWGSNPVTSHPRHMERYAAFPTGQFVPGGREGRMLVVVDVQLTETSQEADLFIQVEPGGDFDLLWTLRGLVQGLTFSDDDVAGVPMAVLRNLVERMKHCQCGVFFFGLGLTQRGVGHANVEALLRLVRDLNAHTRFHARRMRVYGDVAGADTVLCWQTGFPFSVNLARGYPRYSPGEYSANDLLARGEVDACLLVGSEGIEPLSAAAKEQLAKIPVIVLDYPEADIPVLEPPLAPAVKFTTAVYGIHRPGTAYRMDEVPIPLRPMLSSDYPSDDEVLSAILQAVGRG
ncbi:MAG: formylmethanofuran dehydrogenase subunit B [Planctomycetales bacterium]|nr:formylmethanofuran dehydrogenase subunit B [Planctomycetales bacterium]